MILISGYIGSGTLQLVEEALDHVDVASRVWHTGTREADFVDAANRLGPDDAEGELPSGVMGNDEALRGFAPGSERWGRDAVGGNIVARVRDGDDAVDTVAPPDGSGGTPSADSSRRNSLTMRVIARASVPPLDSYVSPY